jgi:CheY-like chemotaxis protein
MFRELAFDNLDYSAASSVLAARRFSATEDIQRALVIGGDRLQRETCRRALRASDVESSWTRLGSDALAAARRTHFGLVLVDVALPDMSGMDVVRALYPEDESVMFILLSDSAAMSRGAGTLIGTRSVLESPFGASDVISVISAANAECAIGHERDRTPRDAQAATHAGGPVLRATRKTPGSAAERWADLVLRVIDAEEDPKTLTSWARHVGVSQSALRECCGLVHVPARASRDFARLVRAICRSGETWEPEAFLDFADARTLRKLLGCAGCLDCRAQTPTMSEFLKRQQWVPVDNPGLAALRHLLFSAAYRARP